MHRLKAFLKRIYVILIFLVLEGAALWQYATSSPYTEAKILARTTAIGGAISGIVTDIQHFFSLPDENRMLTARIAELEEELAGERMLHEASEGDVVVEDMGEEAVSQFRFRAARVSSLTTNRLRNYVVLDKGSADGIGVTMGVITPTRELVGYVVSCSAHYSVVMPIINKRFNTGGRIIDGVENGYVCSVLWNGSSKYHALATDISINSPIDKGMLVEVSSERLPQGIAIGYVESFELNEAKTAYFARLKLAADMSSLDNVIVVENIYGGEVKEMLEELNK
ncbi:MAG: rod shape-determining protein MreC [Alistipes sp.]|jgi:rod shape-determining protein MreC|nr:rod shape-determining protein MreC [Alistipes sp.]